MRLIDDLDRLNDQQKKIVRGFSGPSLVLAGPGTGKTRTIAVLIGQLLAGGLRMKECLALSFSEKAANELRERVLAYHPHSFDECWISTFHSFCARLLREQFHLVGIHPEFKLLTGFKEAMLMGGLARRLPPEPFPLFGPVLAKRGFQQEVLTFISLLKSNLVTPDDLERALRDGDAFPKRALARLRELLALYRAYEEARTAAGYLDFRDLIRLAIEVIRDPEAARLYREKFRVMLIDEFQDTDPAQFHLLSLLQRGAERPRIMVIGDPRQSIYRFRGANPGMMGRAGAFRQTFKARVFPLRINYRNAENILQIVERLAWHDREGGNREDGLIARSGRTGFVEVTAAADELGEARFIARRIASLIIYGAGRRFAPEEIALLVRNNYQIDLLTEALRALHVPFSIAGDMKFFRSEEVTTLISLLKAAGAKGDDREEALRRAFVSPLFRMDPLWVQGKLASLGAGTLAGFLEDLIEAPPPPSAPEGEEPSPLREPIPDLLSEKGSDGHPEDDPEDGPGERLSGRRPRPNPPLAESAREGSGWGETPDQESAQRALAFAATWRMLEDSRRLPLTVAFARLLLTVRESLADPASAAARNIFLLRNMIADFAEVWTHQNGREPLLEDLLPHLDELLTYYASTLEEAKEAPTAGVRVMTIHQSKGLEFPVVVVCGLSEGMFPVEMREDRLLTGEGLLALQARLDAAGRPVPFFNPYPADPEDHLEEERRLFYVALTRAQEGLLLTWPRRVGTDLTSPAPFLAELGLPAGEETTESRPLSLSELRVRLAGLTPEQGRDLAEAWNRDRPSPDDAAFLDRLRPPPAPPPQVDRIELPADFRFTPYAIQAYLECPRRFFLKHVLRVRDPAEGLDPSLAFGRALHSCLEHLHREDSPWAGGVKPPPAALAAAWEEFGTPELAGLGPLLRAQRQALARQALDRYVAAVYDHGQLPFRGQALVEAGFEFSLGGFRCRGRFDRVIEEPGGGEAWIIDYKTSTTTRSGEKMMEQAFPAEGGLGREIQMPFYLLAGRRLAGLRLGGPDGSRRVERRFLRVAAVTVYLRSEPYVKNFKKYKPGYLRSAALNLGGGPDWGLEIDPARFDRFEAELTDLLQRIAGDRRFECLPSADPDASTCLAGRCEFLPFCQERLAILKDRPFPDPQTGTGAEE